MLIVYAGLVGVIGILIINLAIAISRSKFTPLLGIGNVEKLVFGIENIGYALVVVAALAIMQVNLDSLILGGYLHRIDSGIDRADLPLTFLGASPSFYRNPSLWVIL